MEESQEAEADTVISMAWLHLSSTNQTANQTKAEHAENWAFEKG